MKKLVRKNIWDLKPYEPGKPIEELERELGVKGIVKLASNENPLGPSPKAIEAIRAFAKEVHRYPDSSGFYLKNKLSRKLKVKPENVILGNGSDEIIDMIVKTFLDSHHEALIAEPSFLEYKIIVKTRGAKIKSIPMENFRYDIDLSLIHISEPTRPY